MTDNIFGNMLEQSERLKMHLADVEGVHHLYRRFPLDPLPEQPVELYLTTSGPLPYDTPCCWYTIDGSEPSLDSSMALDMVPFTAEWDSPFWGIIRKWSVKLPPLPKKTHVRYRLAARRVDTREWIQADNGSVFAFYVDDDPPPAWAHNALIYQIFPDRFYPGNGSTWNQAKSLTDFFGGTLRGVIDKLGYIQDLGFNTIWINPFFKTSSHHGYNSSDYYTVEPRLGTDSDIKELIKKVHKRGMRIILDFVANHWSREHFTFQEAQQNPQSQYKDWYIWNHWPDDYECYFKVKELPKINLNNRYARVYMLDVARFWLREGFDGYRLDFAYGPSHDFWVDFRLACKEEKPDCWIFGEVIHTAEMLRSYTGIMDGTLDFYLTSALRNTFASDNMSLVEFESFLSTHEAFFPPQHNRPSFLDNHDEERFLFLAGNQKSRLELAALVQYTLPGPPIVYYGTETGLSQERPMEQNGRNIFEECRLPMNWESADVSLQGFYRRMNQLRSTFPVLYDGVRQLLHLDSNNGTYAYLRANPSRKIIVAINTSMSIRSISVPNPGLLDPLDYLHGNQLEIWNDLLTIHLAPQSGAFITSQN